MKPCSFPLLAVCSSLLFVSCSQEASRASVEAMEARLKAQEEAHQLLDQQLGKTLLVIAERMERVADTLDGGTSLSGSASSSSGGFAVDSRANRREPILEEELLHAPASPAHELELQRRTTIWLAAMVGGVIAVAAGLRLRSRAWQSRDALSPADPEESEQDAGAWNEASVLTEAVTPRAEVETIGEVDDSLVADSIDQPKTNPVVRADASASTGSTLVAKPVLVAPRSVDGLARCAFLIDALQPAAARTAIEAYLRHDPRVLQKPEPSVRAREGGISVECAMLPGLPEGEKEHLRAILERLASTR